MKIDCHFLSSNKISANIPKFYLFQIAWMFVLMFTINVVFFRENGISISQITVLDVLWAAVAFALEVPTGALADRWSRKYMLVLSGLFAALGLFVYSISSTFLPFALATMLMAMRNTFSSGTANALLYDSLKKVGKEVDFEKILGKTKFLGTVSVSLAGVLGSYLANSNIRLPFVVSIFTSLLAALIALTFREPKFHTSTGEVKYFDHIKQSVRYIWKSPLIRFLLVYLIIMDMPFSYLDEYDQLYLALINFPLAYFGIWIALRRGLGGLGGLFAERLKGRLRDRTETIALLTMFSSLLIISLAGKYFGLLAFLVVFPVWGAMEVLISGELHSHLESYQRATIESFVVFFGVIADAPIRLAFGGISDFFGIKVGYFFMAVLLVLYLPYFFWSRRDAYRERQKSLT